MTAYTARVDDVNAGAYPMGAASRWWLHQSLAALNKSLNGGLVLIKGDAKTILPQLQWFVVV